MSLHRSSNLGRGSATYREADIETHWYVSHRKTKCKRDERTKCIVINTKYKYMSDADVHSNYTVDLGDVKRRGSVWCSSKIGERNESGCSQLGKAGISRSVRANNFCAEINRQPQRGKTTADRYKSRIMIGALHPFTA